MCGKPPREPWGLGVLDSPWGQIFVRALAVTFPFLPMACTGWKVVEVEEELF